jgi:selenocysteine-specific elongation factor
VVSALHYILATAGHVDHGKSALVKALTGTDPDRLPEEKARGITIDLGFACLQVPSQGDRSSARDAAGPTFCVGIVDVPGHEDFVSNMVAGVGSVDLALLAVAADDGWMPQTEEHLQILTYLDVRSAVIALTKIDLVPGQEQERLEAVRARLRGSPLADAPIVPTSTVTGRGFAELKAALAEVLARTPSPRDIGKPRLPVDRVFVLKGIGTVATGTLNGGTLRRGQAAVTQPSGLPARIRTVHTYGREVEESGPGTRTAVNLPDAEACLAGQDTGLARGAVITLPGLGGGSETLDVLLERSGRSAARDEGDGPTAAAQRAAPAGFRASRPLKHGGLVRVHHGSANTPARIVFRSGASLAPGEQALAELRLERPVFAFAGDRFIVRDWPEQTTLAGGLVLDPDADRKRWHSEAQERMLQERTAAPADAATWVKSLVARDGVVARPGLLSKSRFSAAEVRAASEALGAQGQLILTADLVFWPPWWESVRRRAESAVDAAHQAHPERPGLVLSELRGSVPEAQHGGVFDALLADMCQHGFQRQGNAVRRAGHRPSLPPHLQAAQAQLQAVLSARQLDPPSRKELAPDPVSQQALRFLFATGEAVELSPDVALGTEAYQLAVERILAHLQLAGPATVSQLRQLLGSSRRVLVPLLEKLDREGLTQRQGDVRVPARNR